MIFAVNHPKSATDKQLLLYLLGLTSVEAALLLFCSESSSCLVLPLQNSEEFCSDGDPIGQGLVIGFNVILILGAIYCAIATDNVAQQFKEAKVAGFAVYIVVLFIVVGLLVGSVLDTPRAIFQSACTLVAVISATGMYVFPKFLNLHEILGTPEASMKCITCGGPGRMAASKKDKAAGPTSTALLATVDKSGNGKLSSRNGREFGDGVSDIQQPSYSSYDYLRSYAYGHRCYYHQQQQGLYTAAFLGIEYCILFISEQLAELAKKYGAIESIEMDPTIPHFAFYNLDYKRFAHIVFTSPAAATRAQKAIDGLKVDGRKLVCDKVPDRDHGNIPRTLSITPVVYVNPVPWSPPLLPVPVLLPMPDHRSRRSQRHPQSSRHKNVKSSQKAVPAAKGAKEVTIDLTGDENTVNDRSDCGPPCTARAAEHNIASASNPLSHTGTRKRPHRTLSPSESSRSRDPSPETARKKGRFDDDTTPVKSNQASGSSAADNCTSGQENQGAGPVMP
ncbi:hypothetical protein HK104_008420 [Borealophlyctis nickersoniae]|nr:hypothetical protein HK104_008420 [Borealophlyctis nickersoniae]